MIYFKLLKNRRHYNDIIEGICFNSGPFKNRVVTFEFPQKVLLYKEFLKTLNYKIITNGVGGIIKLAIIMNRDLFDTLEENGEKPIL